MRLLGLLAAGLAWAGPDARLPDDLRVEVMPWDAPERFAARGASGSGQVVCVPLVPTVQQACLSRVQGDKRSWVTQGDLAGWSVEPGDVIAHMASTAEASLPVVGEWREVQDLPGKRYWISTDPTLSGTPYLSAPAVTRLLGSEHVRLASPNVGITLAWPGGDQELDRVMMVAVYEMYDKQTNPISPAIIGLDKAGQWVRIGQARPREDGQVPTP